MVKGKRKRAIGEGQETKVRRKGVRGKGQEAKGERQKASSDVKKEVNSILKLGF